MTRPRAIDRVRLALLLAVILVGGALVLAIALRRRPAQA